MRLVHSSGPLSRSKLVALTGLNRTTVGALVSELADRGLVYEAPAAPDGNPGRPSMVVYPRAEGAVAIAVDISVDSVAVAAIGYGGTVLKEARIEPPRNQRSPEQTVEAVAVLYHTDISPGLSRESLVGIGVSIAGVAASHDGIARLVPNLGWRDVPLASMIAKAFESGEPVYLGNDADLGALAEHARGVAVGIDNFVYLTGEAGVGGGLIIDGGPMEGAAGYVGEVGHFPLNPTGRPCTCGSQGCWETEVGEKAILRRAGYPEDGAQAAIHELLAAAERGDPQVLRAMEETGYWLGLGIAGLVNIFNPSMIVLARLFASIHPFVAEAMNVELDRRALAATRGHVAVVTSALGEQGPLLGAAELAFQPLLQDPAAVWTDEQPATDSSTELQNSTTQPIRTN